MLTVSGPALGIGLIGVGRHGRRYLNHLHSDVPGATVAAVCRKHAQERLEDYFADIPIYGDYQQLIDDPLVQAVVVVTTPALCRNICLSAVEAGKPLLIEKPLALTGIDGRAMVAAAEKAGVMLMTAQTMRFDPTVLLVKEQLPALGRLQEAGLASHIEWRSGSATGRETPLGAMLELGVHLVDLVRFMTGEEISEAACSMDRPSGSTSEAAARAQVRTTGGIRCALDIARVEAGRKGMMTWRGTEGEITADWIRRTVVLRVKGREPREWTIESRPTIVAVLRSFIQAVTTRTTPPVTGFDGCRAVEVVDACYASAERGGKPVCLAMEPF